MVKHIQVHNQSYRTSSFSFLLFDRLKCYGLCQSVVTKIHIQNNSGIKVLYLIFNNNK